MSLRVGLVLFVFFFFFSWVGVGNFLEGVLTMCNEKTNMEW
jgi:hypothetical protein